MKQITLAVVGMHCGGCEQRLQRAMGRIDGTVRTVADHRRGEVRVAFDEARTSEQAIRACIEQAGYEVPR